MSRRLLQDSQGEVCSQTPTRFGRVNSENLTGLVPELAQRHAVGPTLKGQSPLNIRSELPDACIARFKTVLGIEHGPCFLGRFNESEQANVVG